MLLRLLQNSKLLGDFEKSTVLERAERNDMKEKKKFIYILFFVVLASISICMLSPRNILTPNGIPFTDSSVFEYMARIIDQGKVPYKDAFDHKGPLLYLINFVALKLNRQFGLWIVECCFMFATILGIYCIARIFSCQIKAIIVTLTVLGPLAFFFEGGNLTEEYALPFQIWALFIFVEYLVRDRISGIRVVLCGAFLGSVLLLRPNMISEWIVFSLYIFVDLTKRKQYKKLTSFVVQFVMGIIIVVMPVILYLIGRDGFNDFISDYIVYNRLYSDVSLFNRIKTMFFFLRNPKLLVAIAFCVVVYKIVNSKKNRNKFDIVYLIYMMVSLVLVSMSGRLYYHYGMTLLPMLIYPYATLYNCIFEEMKCKKRWLRMFVGIGIFGGLVVPCWLRIFLDIGITCKNMDENRNVQFAGASDDYEKMIKYIREETRQGEKISVYSIHDVAIYNLSNTFSSSKYFFPPQFPEFLDIYYAELMVNNPKIVVLKEECTEQMSEFLMKYEYSKAKEFGVYTLYQQAD